MLHELRALDPDLVPDSLTAETFIKTGEEVATFIQSLPSDEELLHEFTIENTSNKDVEMIDATKRNQLRNSNWARKPYSRQWTWLRVLIFSKTMILQCK